MTTKKKTFDSKCYDLAKHFLSDRPDIDTEETRDELATEIQAAIEAWFEDHEPV